MEEKYIDFIGTYDNVFSEEYCDHMISEFERFHNEGMCGNRQNFEGSLKTDKQDEFIGLNILNHEPSNFYDRSALSIFWNGLQDCFDLYTEEYDVLKTYELTCTSVKMQKTSPGGGYHLWHHEQTGNVNQQGRCLVYSVYLNTLEEAAGETEFLYQRLRIKPKKGSVVIWPAGFTHTHRGNVVHGNDPKYIITGWFHYQ
jgi:hypothetical protein